MALSQQDIRKRAAGPETPTSTIDKKTPYKGYIIKLKNTYVTSGQAVPNLKNSAYKIQLKAQREEFKSEILKTLNKKRFTLGAKNETGVHFSGNEDINIIGEYDNSFNGVALDVTDQEVEAIKNSPLVDKVYKNYQVKKSLNESVPLIKAPFAWEQKDASRKPVTGQGVKIAIIDTGIDYTHPSLGATNITEREFTKVSDFSGANYYDSNYFQLNNNRFVYIKGLDSISIYNFNTGNTRDVELHTDKFMPNPVIESIRINGNNIVYYAESNTGALFIYNIATGLHKKIGDLTVRNTNSAYVSFFFIYGGYVYYVKALNNECCVEQPYKLIRYRISTGEKTTIASDIDPIFFKTGDNLIYQDYRYQSCRPKSTVLHNLVTGEKKTITSKNMGYLQDSNYGKVIYTGPCRFSEFDNSLYLYDINTGEEKKISYRKDIIGKEINPQGRVLSTFFLPSSIKIGEGVVFFDKYNSWTVGKIIAYDYIKDRYVQITLKTGIGLGLEVAGKKVCFRRLSNSQYYCHNYDPDYSYPLPDHIFNSKVVGGFNFLNGEEDPFDDEGHGTHVAGIAAGNGDLKGVAPEAQIISYKVLDDAGQGNMSNVILAIEKAMDTKLDSDTSNDIDVINLSLGRSCYGYDSECGPDDIISQAVDTAVDLGISVTVAAGNSGPDRRTIGSPATSRKAITVGAIRKNKTIPNFSSRGPVIWNSENIKKPDIVAPGVNVCSSRMFGLRIDNRDECLGYKGNISADGTSMASPHIAGAIALIKQAKPDFTPQQIKNIIKNNAEDLGYAYNEQGAGMINLRKIFNEISRIVSPSPSQAPSPTVTSIPTPTLTPRPSLSPSVSPTPIISPKPSL